MANVLVISRDAETAQNLMLICTAHDHRCTWATSMLSGRLALEKEHFDLGLIDGQLNDWALEPLLHGWPWEAAALRLRTIVFSACEHDLTAYGTAGADLILTGPFKAETIVDAVKRALADNQECPTLPGHPDRRDDIRHLYVTFLAPPAGEQR